MKNRNPNEILKLVKPLITDFNDFFESTEPYAIKVYNYLVQDIKQGDLWMIDIILIDESTNVNDIAKYPVLEMINPDVLFESEGILTLKNVNGKRYEADLVYLKMLVQRDEEWKWLD